MRRKFFSRAALPCLLGIVMLAGGPALANPSILFDARTGQIIESENPLQRWYPASLTKLMTIYVAFRAVDDGEVTLLSPVRISKKAASQPPSKMGYKSGSELTLDTALKIIMVKSANDVAAAIGESLAGSQEAFAARMNAEARRLGMSDSHWVNPHGLHDDGQFTTARDMALLATALRREFPQHTGYFSIEGLSTGDKVLPSHNNLIGRFEGADGMKTGYTCPSGFNLVASATRGGRTLMAVVMGSESVATRDEKAAGLLLRGFSLSNPAGPALGALPASSAQPDGPVNMFDQICSKEARAAKAKAATQAANAKKAGNEPNEAPSYLGERTGERQLVAIRLGGATGPMSKAMAAAQFADVPIPTWRPDRPAPGAAISQQGAVATGQM